MHPHKCIPAETWEVGEKEQDCLPSSAARGTSQTSCKHTPAPFFTHLCLAVSKQIVSGGLHKARVWLLFVDYLRFYSVSHIEIVGVHIALILFHF